MKKTFVVLLIAFAVFAVLSCKTTGKGDNSSPKIEGEVTQEKVNDTLNQIYETYRIHLIFDGARNYTTVHGDTLSAITRKYYGSLTDIGDAGPSNGFYFPLIMMASNSNIVDPDFIEPGMELRIVDLKKNLDDPVARKAIKDFIFDVAYVYNKKGATVTEDGLRKLADSL
jgi:hypothetical protein